MGEANASANVEFTLNVAVADEDEDGPGVLQPESTPRFQISSTRSSSVTEYCLYTRLDDPAASQIITRLPLVHVDSAEAYTYALARLNECISGHAGCPRPSSARLPTRVIDCQDLSKPRLIYTHGISSSYLALSYVWGPDKGHITLQSTVNRYLVGIDPSVIPKTIMDAITVTHKLGMRYLWVDAFCIIQDDDEDRNHELERMGQIYCDAYLTIIASSAAHGQVGILEDRPMPAYYASHPCLPYYCSDGRRGTVFVFTEGQPKYEPMKEPVDHRAWCHQERLLSPRKLVYTTAALEYHCQTVTVPVNNSIRWWGVEKLNKLLFGLSDDVIRSKVAAWTEEDWGLLQMEWVLVVSAYTRRALTYRADKLVAFAGIAEQFARVWHATAGRYVAGLWEKHLPRDLLWQLDDRLRARPAEYIAPSWSWASVDGHVRVKPPVYCEDKACEVLSCNVTLLDERQRYGRVSAGTIEIRATVVPAPPVISRNASEQYYKLVVPTNQLRERMTAMPAEGVVVGSHSLREKEIPPIVVYEEETRCELMAVAQSGDVDKSLLEMVGDIFIAFDGPETGKLGRTRFVVIYREDIVESVHTEGLIVMEAEGSHHRRVGYWMYSAQRRGSDEVGSAIPWLRSGVRKQDITLV